MALFGPKKPDIEKLEKNRDIAGLNRCLADSNAFVRGYAARVLVSLALRKIGDVSSVPLLNMCLTDSDKYVRENAAAALGSLAKMKIGDASSVPQLNKCLTVSDEGVRGNAAAALWSLAEMEIGDTSSVPLLNRCLRDSSEWVRRNAALALASLAEMKIGDASSVPLLNKCLIDSDAYVRRNAALALKALNVLLEERKKEQKKLEEERQRKLEEERLKKLEEERQALLKQASNYERARNWLKALELYKRAGNIKKIRECAMNHAQWLCSGGRAEEAAEFLESHEMFEEAGRIRELTVVSKPPLRTIPAPPIPPAAGLEGKVSVLSALNYEKAHVVYKVKVENNGSAPIANIVVKPYIEGSGLFRLDRDEDVIPMLESGKSQTVTFLLRPQKECGNVDISGRVTYYDTSQRKTHELELQKKSTSIICPLMKRVKIGEEAWRDAAGSMLRVEETTEEIPLRAEMLFEIVNDVLQDLNLYRLEPKITKEQTLTRAISRFYCEGVKGLRYCAYAEVVGSEHKSKLILRAYAENEQALIGFYHRILDDIEKRTRIKEYLPTVVKHIDIRDSVIYKSDIV